MLTVGNYTHCVILYMLGGDRRTNSASRRDVSPMNDDQTMQVDYVTLWFDRTANADE